MMIIPYIDSGSLKVSSIGNEHYEELWHSNSHSKAQLGQWASQNSVNEKISSHQPDVKFKKKRCQSSKRPRAGGRQAANQEKVKLDAEAALGQR
jgi:hypothetical protein